MAGSWYEKAAVAVYSREIILKKLAHDFETGQCLFLYINVNCAFLFVHLVRLQLCIL